VRNKKIGQNKYERRYLQKEFKKLLKNRTKDDVYVRKRKPDRTKKNGGPSVDGQTSKRKPIVLENKGSPNGEIIGSFYGLGLCIEKLVFPMQFFYPKCKYKSNQ
jgi:hypothetical protein